MILSPPRVNLISILVQDVVQVLAWASGIDEDNVSCELVVLPTVSVLDFHGYPVGLELYVATALSLRLPVR